MPLVRTGAVLADGTDVDWTPLGPFDHLRAGVLPSGVPVLWAPGDGLTTARLVFKVGVEDEALVERGTTHLVEHLAHSSLGLPAHGNASVGGSWTEFDVRGTPEQVEHHLREVARALGDLPVHRLAAEIEVLRLEHARRSADPWIELRERRHGVRGPVMRATQELAVLRDDAASERSAERAREWARTWFTTENAVLWVHGPEPAPWQLELPTGQVPERQDAPASARTQPAWFSGTCGVVAFSATADDHPAAYAAWWWLQRLMQHRLRLLDSAVYDVDVASDRLGAGHLELFMAAHTTPERGAAVFRAVQEVVSSACVEDVPVGELEDWQREVEEDHRDPQVVGTALAMQQVDTVADALLRQPPGARDPVAAASAVRGRFERRRDLARELTPERVRHELVTLMGTALLQVPEDVDGPRDVAHLSPLSERGLSAGAAFAAARHLPGGQRMIVNDLGIMVEPAPAVTLTVLWEDCVAVVVHPDGRRSVYRVDGMILHVDRQDWARGDAAVAALDAAAPARLVVPMTGGATHRHPPLRTLSGVASMRTGSLVVLVLALSLFALFFVGSATASENALVAWGFAGAIVAADALFVHGLVRRLRVPRNERATVRDRARTGAAVAFDEALARGTRGTALGIAVGAWIFAVAVLLAGVPSGHFYWPGLLIAGLAIRATLEFKRRRFR